MEKYTRHQLDQILIELCDLIIQRQKIDSRKWGLVGAAFIDQSTGQRILATSVNKSGKWQHAERTAINIFRNRFGYLPENSLIVVTLSPCSGDISDRFGSDCESLIESLTNCQVYAAYQDPTQTSSNPNFEIAYTNNSKIKQLCKSLADQFLHDDIHKIMETVVSTDPNDWSEAEQIAYVKQNYENIKQIKHPSEAVQLAAVQQRGSAIQYITNPSLEVQMAAVQQDGHAIYYIKNPTIPIQLAAVQQNGHANYYITNPCLEVQLAAVQQDGRAICYITNPTPLIQTAACFQNPKAINEIYPIESTNISLMKKYRDKLNDSRRAYLERIENETLTESIKSLGITAAAILTSAGVLSQAINLNQDYIQQTIDANFKPPENTSDARRSSDNPTPVVVQQPNAQPQITTEVEKVVEFLQRPLAKELLESAQRHGIKGMELLQLIAQCAHETANFTTLRERGTRQEFLQQYDRRHNPEAAEILGNEHPGDGAKYYGRGYIQLTGRDNYRRAGQALNLPLEAHPELVEKDPKIAAETTIWFWKTQVAAKTDNFEDTKTVTKPINRTLHGIEDREANFRGLKQFLHIMQFKNNTQNQTN